MRQKRYIERTVIKNNTNIKIKGNIEEVDDAVTALLKCNNSAWRLKL